jgi:methionyl-tRNA synthetase
VDAFGSHIKQKAEQRNEGHQNRDAAQGRHDPIRPMAPGLKIEFHRFTA